jgi:hypothetical protein
MAQKQEIGHAAFKISPLRLYAYVRKVVKYQEAVPNWKMRNTKKLLPFCNGIIDIADNFFWAATNFFV